VLGERRGSELSGCRRAERDANGHARSFAGGALDRGFPAEQPRPLPDSLQPESAAIDLLDVEAYSPISDIHTQLAVALFDFDSNFAVPAVLPGIGQQLLNHAVDCTNQLCPRLRELLIVDQFDVESIAVFSDNVF
jgi:hypothetical protein